MSRSHELRSWPHLFKPIKLGTKTHDLRSTDRGIEVGDFLHLREWDIATGRYTGDSVSVEVTYITGREEGQSPCAFSSAVLAPGYCLLSIRLIKAEDNPF